jgi:hypothetical protein
MQFLLPGADAVSARRGGCFYRESYDFAQPCGPRGKNTLPRNKRQFNILLWLFDIHGKLKS